MIIVHMGCCRLCDEINCSGNFSEKVKDLDIIVASIDRIFFKLVDSDMNIILIFMNFREL